MLTRASRSLPLRHLCTAAPSAAPPASPSTPSRFQTLKAARKAAPPPKRRAAPTFDKAALYALPAALAHVRTSSWASFDESVEIVFALNLDPRRAEQNIRGVTDLPFGAGSEARVAVFATGAAADDASAAGADIVGGDELVEDVLKTKGAVLRGFNVVATPEMGSVVADKCGRVLGPKGLLPSAKTGSVTADVGAEVRRLRKGLVKWRVARDGRVSMKVGKLSFGDEEIVGNVLAATRAVVAARPDVVKKKYMGAVTLSSSMGAGVKVEAPALTKMALDPDRMEVAR